ALGYGAFRSDRNLCGGQGKLRARAAWNCGFCQGRKSNVAGGRGERFAAGLFRIAAEARAAGRHRRARRFCHYARPQSAAGDSVGRDRVARPDLRARDRRACLAAGHRSAELTRLGRSIAAPLQRGSIRVSYSTMMRQNFFLPIFTVRLPGWLRSILAEGSLMTWPSISNTRCFMILSASEADETMTNNANNRITL